jgi:hypothetical protein
MFTTTGRMLRLGLFLLAAAGCYGANPAGAAKDNNVCPDNGGTFPTPCTKEIRIYNNTPGAIWPVIQASIQLTDAINCTVKDKGGGDVWLQRALGDTTQCFAVKNDYYAFVNPGVGIPANSFASISLPWWSKTTGPDQYIDWWRAGRLMLFDDKTAQTEIYNQTKAIPAAFAGGTPKPSCKTGVCNQLQIFRVPSGSGIDAHLPIQLNEYTFADIAPLAPPDNGRFVDFNQNYNVSNVDQVYLPVAIEPVRNPPNVGYLGTTMSLTDFRTQLDAFVNSNKDWPTYNNPTVNNKKMYPSAGTRVPSAQSVMGFYMNPGTFPDGKSPILLPKVPPTLVQNMLDQWKDCTLDNPQHCTAAQAGFYDAVNSVFLDNYKSYITTCPDKNVPDYLKQVPNSNPPAPKLTAFLTFIYGWVPFNVACPNKELPVANSVPPASRSVIDYTHQMQYNYKALRNKQSQWFNPYTQLIHDPVASGGLAASAYAFSIDDDVSFLSNSGGTLPGGLILAVGGPNGLQNKVQHAPPVPKPFDWYSFSIGLGDPGNGPFWQKYGICSDTADTLFPTEERGAWVIGVDPAITKIDNCKITLQDSANNKYQLNIIQANVPGTDVPQKAIWKAWDPQTSPSLFDPTVLSCPTGSATWCKHSNEVSKPPPSFGTPIPGFYTIGARKPCSTTTPC